jgi:hypothetical protein
MYSKYYTFCIIKYSVIFGTIKSESRSEKNFELVRYLLDGQGNHQTHKCRYLVITLKERVRMR